MKKSLRSKILLCVLAGGVLAANTALAAEYTEAINGANDTSYSAIKEQSGNDYTYNFTDGDSLNLNNEQNGVVISSDSDVDSITINGKLNITLTNDSKNTYDTLSGIRADYGTNGKTINYAGGEIQLDVNSNSAYFAGGILAAGFNDYIKIGDTDISVALTSNDKFGISAVGIDVLVEGDGTNGGNTVETGNINIDVRTNATISKEDMDDYYYNEAIGIVAQQGSTLTVNGTATINSVAQGNGAIYAYGVLAYNDNYAAEGIESVINLGIADITAEAVYDEEKQNNPFASGIYAYNSGTVNMDGGSIKAITDENNGAAYSIYTFSDGEVNINQTGGNDVVIDGDIADYGGKIKLNLDTENSVLSGAAATYRDSGELTLNLANGATWNNEGSSYITTLTMDGGVINQNDANNITINNFAGSGDINYAADTVTDGVLSLDNIGSVKILTAAEDSALNLSITNNDLVDTLDSAKITESLTAIANKLTYNANDGNLKSTINLKEGLITPGVSAEILFDDTNQTGYVAAYQSKGSTTTVDNIKNVTATNIIAWRQEDSTLSQRLGELRHSDGGQGVWVRMSRGEFEYGGEYKNQYNYFQMGYDWAAKDWHYGAAVSHNDGQTTYTHGKGENSSTSLNLYGTWLGSKGHYADIVLKQGRLSNDFDIYTSAGHTGGDYDAWGTSLSGEYGRKVELNDGWFITPQAQLTLMRIGGEDYTTNNGIKVHQDTLTSAVGRVGFEVGKQIDGRGSVYAKASLLHDFAGSADTYLTLNGLSNSYRQDISDTWCEAGLGFNYKTSANSYIYADVVKTFGGDLETPWQWNAGMRWMF